MRVLTYLLLTTASLSTMRGGVPAESEMAQRTETTLIDPALLGFGAPGFSIAITGSQTMDFKNGRGSVDYFDGRAQLPVWGRDLKNGTFLGVTLSGGFASLDVNGALGVKKLSLGSVDLQLSGAHFPTGDQGWMGLAILSSGLSSDFGKISGDDFAFTAIIVAGYQFSPRFTLAAAAFYDHSIGEDTALPGIGVIWRPTDTLTLQLTPPIAAIGWTPVKAWTFSVSAYPSGGAWDVDRAGRRRDVEAIKLEGWRAGLGVERRIGAHLRFTAQIGMNFAGKIELRDSSQRVLLGENLDSSAFGLLGVAWSF